MHEGIMQFRGLIHTKYKSEAELAHAIGWKRQKLNKITTGKKVPTISELADLAPALSCSLEQLASYFLQ